MDQPQGRPAHLASKAAGSGRQDQRLGHQLRGGLRHRAGSLDHDREHRGRLAGDHRRERPAAGPRVATAHHEPDPARGLQGRPTGGGSGAPAARSSARPGGEMLAQFRELWCVDFEYRSTPGNRPDPVCLVARELRSGQAGPVVAGRSSGPSRPTRPIGDRCSSPITPAPRPAVTWRSGGPCPRRSWTSRPSSGAPRPTSRCRAAKDWSGPWWPTV